MVSGSCHCGAVKFTVDGVPDKAIECNCSHCSRKGFLLWFAPRTSLSVDAGGDTLKTYTFNKHAIQHRFCPTCGCQPFGLGSDQKGNEMAAINLRCLEGFDVDSVPRVPVNGREF